MAPKTEDPEQIGKRFMFISNDTFKVINNDGFEKYFKMSGDKLKVVGYGVIPMIDVYKLNHATSNAHFYEEYVFDKKCIQSDLK